jgi:hydroxymethylbilane synthase
VRALRIGTRGSVLAKWQAEYVRKRLYSAAGVEAEIVIIKTSGDKLPHAHLSQIGGKGIFIKELEDALFEETIDVAVHSVKDIPTAIPPRVSFPAIFRREDVRDCIVSANGATPAQSRKRRIRRSDARQGRTRSSGLVEPHQRNSFSRRLHARRGPGRHRRRMPQL